jgi:hypothetical protein
MSTSHECPAGRCTRRVGAHMLMCRPHWFMVPKPLRDDVWNAWAGGMGAGSPEHRDAIMAAVEAVNARLEARP